MGFLSALIIVFVILFLLAIGVWLFQKFKVRFNNNNQGTSFSTATKREGTTSTCYVPYPSNVAHPMPPPNDIGFNVNNPPYPTGPPPVQPAVSYGPPTLTAPYPPSNPPYPTGPDLYSKPPTNYGLF